MDQTNLYPELKNPDEIAEIEVHWYNKDYEETKDIEGVNLFFILNAEFLQSLYTEYASTMTMSKKQALEIISMWDMLKDYRILPVLMSPSQANYIIKKLSAKFSIKNQPEISYDQFIQYFLQLGIFAFRKCNFTRKNECPQGKLELFLDQFKQLRNYDKDPNEEQKEQFLINQLETYIAKNPYYPLPEGYTKVETKVIIENYKIPCYINMHPMFSYIVELVDEIIHKNFGFHVLEPIITYDYMQKIICKPESNYIKY